MLTILTIAASIIAVVLVVAHWQTVRKLLLWANAVIALVALVAGVVALIFAAIRFDLGIGVLGVALLALSDLAFAFEDADRNRRFAKWRTYGHSRTQTPCLRRY